MNETKVKTGAPEIDFEMLRLTKSKQTVDISPNTIRSYAKEGLRLYRRGRAVYFSKSELVAFIRAA